MATKERLDAHLLTAVDKERDTSTFPLAPNASENFLVAETREDPKSKMCLL